MGANVPNVECVPDADSESSDQVVYTDQVSSRTHDTGRATTSKASASEMDMRSMILAGVTILWH